MRLEGFDGVFKIFEHLLLEIVVKCGGLVCVVLCKGVVVIYKEECVCLWVVILNVSDDGKCYFIGLLFKNVVVMCGKVFLDGCGECYLVCVCWKIYLRDMGKGVDGKLIKVKGKCIIIL